MTVVSAALKRAAPAPALPRFRAPFVFGIAAAAVRGARRALALPAVDRQRRSCRSRASSRYSREIEVPAHRGRIVDRSGEPLAISTPVQVDLGVPGAGRDRAGPARAARARARDDAAGAREEARRRQRLRLPREADSAGGRRAGRGAEDQGHPRPERVPALLSGRRDDEPHPRLHRRPRRRAGGNRAHAAGMARRQARQPARDHQPPRRRRRGRRGDHARRRRAATSRWRSTRGSSTSRFAS